MKSPLIAFFVVAVAVVGCSGNDDDGPAGPGGGAAASTGGSTPGQTGGDDAVGTPGAAGAAVGGTGSTTGGNPGFAKGTGGSGPATQGGAGGSATGGDASGGSTSLPPPDTCGNGALDAAEDCEPSLALNKGCADLAGFTAGMLGCTASCSFDTSGCTTCGNGVVDAGEECEPGVALSKSCADVGSFDAGTLGCAADCTFDTAACTIATCNNGVVDAGEDCEPGVAITEKCQDQPGFNGGALACRNNCTFDTAGCTACGDGTVDPAEDCEPGQPLAVGCADQSGFDAGVLACSSDCSFDTARCTKCGNGVREGAEQCDGSDWSAADCAALPAPASFNDGALSCKTDCTFDISRCTECGDGAIEGNEQCDGTKLGGATCANQTPSKPLGKVTCNGACKLDTTGCYSATDSDGDTVADGVDLDPNDFTVCADSDSDGCDDCSLRGQPDPAGDGYDPDGDGQCDLPLDYDCMNGANAATDPSRLEACVLFTHTNNDRAHFSAEAGNAGPLKWNENIWEVAISHAMDMCTRGFFDHQNPDKEWPWDRAKRLGYEGLVSSENIAANLDPGAAEWGYMNEPTCTGHRGAILERRAVEAGIGYVKCEDFASPSDYRWKNHHLTATNFLYDYSIAKSSYCQNAATACELPANPPTTATCPQKLIDWGFCDAPEASMLPQWNCPDD